MKSTSLVAGTVLLAILLPGSNGLTQTGKTFEVASVRPRSAQASSRSSTRTAGTRFDLVNVTARELVARAFQVESRHVVGPEWARRQTFDVRAVMPPEAVDADIPQMLHALLGERFSLKAHVEQRPDSVFELVVEPSGPRFSEVAPVNDLKTEFPNDDKTAVDTVSGLPGAEIRSIVGMYGTRRVTARTMYHRKYQWPSGSSELDAPRITMAEFVDEIRANVDRPIVDKTRLSGIYQFKTLLPPRLVDPRVGAALGINAEPTSISLARSLEGLGLRLEASTAPTTYVVIDNIEQPTPN